MIEIGLGHYLTLGAIIFFLGVIGIFLNRKNVIVILMSVELILLSVISIDHQNPFYSLPR